MTSAAMKDDVMRLIPELRKKDPSNGKDPFQSEIDELCSSLVKKIKINKWKGDIIINIYHPKMETDQK